MHIMHYVQIKHFVRKANSFPLVSLTTQARTGLTSRRIPYRHRRYQPSRNNARFLRGSIVAPEDEPSTVTTNKHEQRRTTSGESPPTAFCSRPPPFQGREQDAAHQLSRSQSSYRDALQRGAMAAPHDDDYPGLSRIILNADDAATAHGRGRSGCGERRITNANDDAQRMMMTNDGDGTAVHDGLRRRDARCAAESLLRCGYCPPQERDKYG